MYAIFDDQNFKDKLTNNIVSLEQLGPGCQKSCLPCKNGRKSTSCIVPLKPLASLSFDASCSEVLETFLVYFRNRERERDDAELLRDTVYNYAILKM